MIGLEKAREILGRLGSYERLPTLLDLAADMERVEWLTLLGLEWSGFDNVGAFVDDIQDCEHLHDVPGPVIEMMTAKERAHLARLPSEITVYRGCYAANKWGVSWSMDRSVAESFPFLSRYSRPNERPILVKGRIQRDAVTALKLDRKEAEIVCLWRRPTHVSTSKAHDRVRD